MFFFGGGGVGDGGVLGWCIGLDGVDDVVEVFKCFGLVWGCDVFYDEFDVGFYCGCLSF